MFEKLLKASDTLSPSVSKLLRKAGLPVGKVSLKNVIRSDIYIYIYSILSFLFLEEKELLRLTNPENIRVDANYRGPR